MHVLITDSKSPGYDHNKEYFESIHFWALKNCPSYNGMSIQDVSDVSYEWDEIAEYRFTDEKDVMFFELKWK